MGVELHVLEGVFAGAGVDAGTRHLLRWLAGDELAGARSVLDLGCGYGPLALWLAAARVDRTVLAVDRDARAMEATALGAAANRLTDRVEVAGSLGYDRVGERPFDLVVSNIPAKIGPAALAHLVLDARHHLVGDGTVAVVVVDRLAAAVADLLADDAVDVQAVHPSRAYTAFLYGFTGDPTGSSSEPGFERGLYRRGRQRFTAGALGWEAEVAYSIPEFDSLSHGTLAALEVLRRPAGTILVHGVGQGHLPLGWRAAGHDGPLRLVDRDLLALQTAATNLAGDVTVRHASRLDPDDPDDLGDPDLVAVALPEKEPVSVTAAILGPALVGYGGRVLLHGRTADLSRVLELLPRHGARLEVTDRTRRGSHGAAAGRVRPARGRR